MSTDTHVVDAIATLLGTQREWNGGDCLEAIANLVGTVRPHPGDTTSDTYRRDFETATGRSVVMAWDSGETDDA